MALNRKKPSTQDIEWTPELLAMQKEIELAQQRLAEAKAKQRAEEARLKAMVEHAGVSYAKLVNKLYDRLGIEPEHPSIRQTKRGPVEVSADKDEALRTQRLYEVLVAVLDAADADLIETLRLEDAETRDRHRDERTKDSGPARSDDSDHSDDDDADGTAEARVDDSDEWDLQDPDDEAQQAILSSSDA